MVKETEERGQVTGFVRNIKEGKDGTTSFVVSGKKFRRAFIIPKGRYLYPSNNDRATVLYILVDGKKHPQIVRIISPTSGYHIHAGIQWSNGEGDLPV